MLAILRSEFGLTSFSLIRGAHLRASREDIEQFLQALQYQC